MAQSQNAAVANGYIHVNFYLKSDLVKKYKFKNIFLKTSV